MNLTRLTNKELYKLKLKGIEVLETLVGSADSDYKGLRLKDAVTGTIIDIRMSAYSDFYVSSEAPPKKVKKFVLSGLYEGTTPVKFQYDKRDAADSAVENGVVTNATVTEIEVDETVDKED